MLILGIETSCDETSVAVVKNGKQILSNVVSSQIKEHSEFGGVVPEIASRLHIERIIQIINLALDKAKIKTNDCDAIAVTYGPGLVGSLLVGTEVAKAISYSLKLPLIPINHIEAHLYSPILENSKITHPYLGLIVSGGHTSLITVKSYDEYEILGETLDDAAGEAFDKVAKFLKLGYPGGPVIDKLTSGMKKSKYTFPIPKIKKGGLDFSFSGLKTAVINLVKKNFSNSNNIPEDEKREIAYAFQKTTIDYLLQNTKKALEKSNIQTIVFVGGVAANSKLREDAKEKLNNYNIYFPSIELCTDNAAMIAGLAYYKIKTNKKTKSDQSISLLLNANPNLKIN